MQAFGGVLTLILISQTAVVWRSKEVPRSCCSWRVVYSGGWSRETRGPVVQSYEGDYVGLNRLSEFLLLVVAAAAQPRSPAPVSPGGFIPESSSRLGESESRPLSSHCHLVMFGPHYSPSAARHPSKPNPFLATSKAPSWPGRLERLPHSTNHSIMPP